VYRILDQSTGLFCSGDYEPRWNSVGKVFRDKRDLRQTLEHYRRSLDILPDSWIVIRYLEVTHKDVEINCNNPELF
jgi:hypothetical protein